MMIQGATDKTSDQEKSGKAKVIQLHLLQESLNKLFAPGSSEDSAFYEALAHFISSRVTTSGAVAVYRVSNGKLDECSAVIKDRGREWSADLLDTLRNGATRVANSGQVAVARLGSRTEVTLLAVPVTGNEGKISHVLSIAFLLDNYPIDLFVALLQLIANTVAMHLNRVKSPSLSSEHSDYRLIKLATRIIENDDRRRGKEYLAQGVKEYFDADTVIFALGSVNGAQHQIIHTGLSGLKGTTPHMKLLEQVVTECRAQNQILTWPGETKEYLNSLIVKKLASLLFTEEIFCIPLFNSHKQVMGVLIICWNKSHKETITYVNKFCKSSEILAGVASWLTAQGPLQKLILKQKTIRKKVIFSFALLCAAIGLAWMPVPFKVTGNCSLEPQQSRFVVAQFDGVLKTIYKIPGDKVQKGDQLAKFDENLIDLELNSLLAKLEKTKKKHDLHLAEGKAALAQIAALERQAIEEQVGLLKDRLEKLTLISPVDGIIISENLRRIEGSPVNRGQGMFEVASLRQMLVEISISQEDIGYIHQGAAVTVKLESFSGKSWNSKAMAILPRSEIRQNRSIFLVETILDNEKLLLQPGMQGKATIEAGSKPLIWKLFRKPWVFIQRTFLAG